jgi:hypothetical protein
MKQHHSFPDGPLDSDPRRAGFALVEVAISTLLVGTLLVASLEGVGSVLKYRNETADSQRGSLLAEELLARILQLDYSDPDDSQLFGREWSERFSTGIYDDVDDYDGYTESPPQDAGGTAINGFSGWERRVSVDWVRRDNLTQAISSDQGVKRITVTIRKNGNTVVTRWGLRSDVARLEVSEL